MRDFSLIFDALTTFEESLLAARMGADEEEPEAAEESDGDGADFMLNDPGSDVDLRSVFINTNVEHCCNAPCEMEEESKH